MNPIVIFYHCLFCFGNPPAFSGIAFDIVHEQMEALNDSGLLKVASEFIVGINGGSESNEVANLVIPLKAKRVLHGLQSHGENRTLLEVEKWSKSHDDGYVLYFHSKGATHQENDPLRTKWRRCMMRNLIQNWIRCVQDLNSGNESVGCHWYTDQYGRSYWAGTFWWATAKYIRSLPSISVQPTIVKYGIDPPGSRFEAEVWIGGGRRLPRRKDYHPQGFTKCP